MALKKYTLRENKTIFNEYIWYTKILNALLRKISVEFVYENVCICCYRCDFVDQAESANFPALPLPAHAIVILLILELLLFLNI